MSPHTVRTGLLAASVGVVFGCSPSHPVGLYQGSGSGCSGRGMWVSLSGDAAVVNEFEKGEWRETHCGVSWKRSGKKWLPTLDCDKFKKFKISVVAGEDGEGKEGELVVFDRGSGKEVGRFIRRAESDMRSFGKEKRSEWIREQERRRREAEERRREERRMRSEKRRREEHQVVSQQRGLVLATAKCALMHLGESECKDRVAELVGTSLGHLSCSAFVQQKFDEDISVGVAGFELAAELQRYRELTPVSS